MTTNTYYRRYTDLPSLIQILSKSSLTLLDPSSWDDKNDSFYLSTYKDKKALSSVLALCFTKESETYHHWKVFSSGASGVCINFNSVELEKAFKNFGNIQFEEVKYLTMKDQKGKQPTVSELPFLKRIPYKHEKEFRALWESKGNVVNALDVPIKLSSITRITLSPWMHPSLQDNTKILLKTINSCKSIPIYRSTLTDNENWKEYARNAL